MYSKNESRIPYLLSPLFCFLSFLSSSYFSSPPVPRLLPLNQFSNIFSISISISIFLLLFHSPQNHHHPSFNLSIHPSINIPLNANANPIETLSRTNTPCQAVQSVSDTILIILKYIRSTHVIFLFFPLPRSKKKNLLQ